MTNDTPLAHVPQLLIMITLVTVSFVVNNGLVGASSPPTKRVFTAPK